MMEPFADIYELFTFISLFIVAVGVIPYVFYKIGEWIER